jgi:precorrin isomerase
LADSGLNIPYFTLFGRRGGSAMAAAALNGLAAQAMEAS